MLEITQTDIFVTQTRIEVAKYVKFSYVGPNRYVVEFHDGGRIRYYRRSGVNRWFKYLNQITRLVMFSGGLYTLKAISEP